MWRRGRMGTLGAGRGIAAPECRAPAKSEFALTWPRVRASSALRAPSPSADCGAGEGIHGGLRSVSTPRGVRNWGRGPSGLGNRAPEESARSAGEWTGRCAGTCATEVRWWRCVSPGPRHAPLSESPLLAYNNLVRDKAVQERAPGGSGASPQPGAPHSGPLGRSARVGMGLPHTLR